MIAGFTLTRYIARMFIVAIGTTLTVCALLIFMIDFVELLRMAGKYGAVPGTTMMYGGVKDASSRARLLDFLESGAVAEPPEKVEEDD